MEPGTEYTTVRKKDAAPALTELGGEGERTDNYNR